VVVFGLVYSPHFGYPYPFHIDEWHQITEALRLGSGQSSPGFFGAELGFHLVLFGMSKIFNLVLVYQYLPAIWAVITALVLFWLVRRKTGNYFVALLAVIFFASIKSDVNITGLWFLTPLSFSLPFIYLYFYLYDGGLQKQKRGLLLGSLGVMIFLVFTHAISVLFALPALIIFSAINFKSVRGQWKFIAAFSWVFLAGFIFFKYFSGYGWLSAVSSLASSLMFKPGFGVVENFNYPTEFYSLAGYLFALAGAIFILADRDRRNKYSLFLLWPVSLLLSFLVFYLFGISPLSPFQRNLYYFAISLPLLSAVGFYFVVRLMVSTGADYLKGDHADLIKLGTVSVFVAISLFATFRSYYALSSRFDLYRTIDSDDYRVLKIMSKMPKAKIMATPAVSEAVFPVSGDEAVGTMFFYGNRVKAEEFFATTSCPGRKLILTGENVDYVLSKNEISCGWKRVYDDNDFVYRVK